MTAMANPESDLRVRPRQQGPAISSGCTTTSSCASSIQLPVWRSNHPSMRDDINVAESGCVDLAVNLSSVAGSSESLREVRHAQLKCKCGKPARWALISET